VRTIVRNPATGSEPITHIILACDESGAKGYADRDEAFPGETGVFAGLMAPAEFVAKVAPDFDVVAAKYATPEGKLHITDLPFEKQAALRNEMFELIRAHKLPCLYEAVHVAGLTRANGRNLFVWRDADPAASSRPSAGTSLPHERVCVLGARIF
jgi:hypothetical protein